VNIKILNFLGGSLFASGLMLGVQNYIDYNGFLTRETINADGERTRLTISSQNRVVKPEELKREEQHKDVTEYSQSKTIMMSIAIIQASLGAGLACLRESRD
jgi:hypothetical protein